MSAATEQRKQERRQAGQTRRQAQAQASRANIRSVTPMGFARAVFQANHRTALKAAA